mmetsp:Transcript_103659/g.180048  ORF Transcript_103659/g.180048 Transcript_103659/m.180048 type:complete len:99 (-) Transcript_103659:461-757(-)
MHGEHKSLRVCLEFQVVRTLSNSSAAHALIDKSHQRRSAKRSTGLLRVGDGGPVGGPVAGMRSGLGVRLLQYVGEAVNAGLGGTKAGEDARLQGTLGV